MGHLFRLLGIVKLGEYLDYLIDTIPVSRLDFAIDASAEAMTDNKLDEESIVQPYDDSHVITI